jgi:hypothetical protein
LEYYKNKYIDILESIGAEFNEIVHRFFNAFQNQLPVPFVEFFPRITRSLIR